MGKGKKAKTAASQVKITPKRPPYRCVCSTCGSSWLGGLTYHCDHNNYVETDI